MITTVLLPAILLVPLLAAAAAWLIRSTGVLHALSTVAHLLILGLALILLGLLLKGEPLRGFGSWLYLDSLGGVLLLVVAAVSLTSALYSIGYLGHEHAREAVSRFELRKYYALLHLFVFTMLLVAVSGNLGLLWTAISGTTLASALLVDFYGSHEPLEAAWKYVLLTSVGSLIALFGILVLYQAGVGALGHAYDFSVPMLTAMAGRLAPVPAVIAFLLILVGFGTKAGLAPMHSWLPDTHSQAPSPVCALLSGVELNCAMLGILRIYAIVTPAAGTARIHVALLVFGVFSLLVAVAFLLSQRDYKRLLAYSSIEHMGLISIGVAIGGPLAIFGALLQLVNHAFTKSLMFFATGNLLLGYRTRTMSSVKGVAGTMPATAILLIAGGLAIAGAPPFGLFISEFSIVTGAFLRHEWLVGAIVVILLLVAFLAILAPFNRMVFSAVDRSDRPRAGGAIPVVALAPAYLSLAVVLVLGFWIPGPLHTLLSGAVKVIAP